MLVKFITDHLTCQIDEWLFWCANEEWFYINNIREWIKKLFNPVKFDNSGNISWGKVELRKYWWKYLNIRYENSEWIWKIINLKKWKIFIMSIKIADNDDYINDNKEVVNNEDWKVLFKIQSNSNVVLSDYYLWIYLTNDVQIDDKWITNLSGYIFYTQKWKANIKMLVKELLCDLIPKSNISMIATVTKKKINEFTWTIKNIVYKTEMLPNDIAPDLDDEVKNSLVVSVKTEIKLKSTSKKDELKLLLPKASKRMFREIVDNKKFGVELNKSEVKIWNNKISSLSLDESEEIIGCIQDYREIKANEFTLEKFTEFCNEFFN